MVYQIRIKGHLGSQWTDWFEGLTITLEDNGDTLLTGPVVDQAALHGLLKKVRDLGMPLVSVSPVEPGQADASDARRQLNSMKLIHTFTTGDKMNTIDRTAEKEDVKIHVKFKLSALWVALMFLYIYADIFRC